MIDWGLARRVGAAIEPAAAAPAGDARSAAMAVPPAETLSELPDGVSRDWSAVDSFAPPHRLATDEPGADLDSGDERAVTLTGEVIGTPAYMPPEQAAGEPVGARADVYSLGATLYFVLAGVAPYAGLSGPVLRRVVTEAPPDLATHAAGVPAALAAIVRRAMARDAADRYAAAGELVSDLRRFLSGRLVAAHQYRPWTLAWWWLRRHRAVAAVAAAATLGLLVIGAASVQRIRREREAAAASANRLRLLQARAELERDPTVAAAWLASYRVEPAQRDLAISVASAAAASTARDLLPVTGATIQRVCVSPDGRVVLGIDRQGEVSRWDRAQVPVTVRRPGSLAEPPASCRVSASGGHALALGRKGALALIDLASGTWTAVPIKARRAAFAGDRVVLAGTDQQLHVIDQPGAAPRLLGKSGFPVFWLAPSPDGASFAVTGPDGSLAVWSLDGAVRALPPHPRPLTSIDLLADGSAVGASSQLVRIDRPDGSSVSLPIDEGRDTVVITAALADSILVADSSSQRLQRWWPDGQRELIGKEVVYDSLAASTDGRRAAWATQDGVVHVLDAASGAQRELRGHGSGVRDLALSGDAGVIVTAAEDASLRVWEPAPPDGPRLRGAATAATAIGASADGTIAIAGDEAGQLTLWRTGPAASLDAQPAASLDAQPAASPGGPLGAPPTASLDAQPGTPLAALSGRIDRIVISRRGDLALVGVGDDRLVLVALAGGAVRELSAGTGVLALGFSAAGDAIALYDDRTVRGFAPTGDARVLLEAKAPYVAGAMTPDGHLALISAFDGLRAIDLATGTATRLTGPDGAAFRVVASPDGRHAVAVTGAGIVWRWSLQALPAGGELPGDLVGRMRGNTTDLTISRDGTIAVTDESGAIALFADGAPPRWLPGHDARAARLAFTASGRLVSCDRRGLLRIWDPTTGATGVAGELRASIRGLVVLGETAIVHDDRGPPRLWHLDRATLAPADTPALDAWIRARTRVRVDATGAIATPVHDG